MKRLLLCLSVFLPGCPSSIGDAGCRWEPIETRTAGDGECLLLQARKNSRVARGTEDNCSEVATCVVLEPGETGTLYYDGWKPEEMELWIGTVDCSEACP